MHLDIISFIYGSPYINYFWLFIYQIGKDISCNKNKKLTQKSCISIIRYNGYATFISLFRHEIHNLQHIAYSYNHNCNSFFNRTGIHDKGA